MPARIFMDEPARLAFCIEPLTRKDLERVAESNARSMSSEIRVAVERHVSGFYLERDTIIEAGARVE